MSHLLLINDDAGRTPLQVRQVFPAPQHRVEVAECGETGMDSVRRRAPDVVILDLRPPDGPGLDVFEAIRRFDGRIPVIFVTESRTADTAIEAMKRGAFNCLHKPVDPQVLKAAVSEALEVTRHRRAQSLAAEAEPTEALDGAIFGGSPAMLEIYKAIGRVAAQDVTVLITGESGTGKGLVARAIHRHSGRSTGPFLALNCAAIPENLLESELFGHERGAFTGADRRRIGKFEQCKDGTLLLDEVGDMPLPLQAKILRVLQEQAFERVGGSETIHANVRVIASTHRDLRSRAEAETFRPDLYYRLGVFTIHLPSLRDRGDDLPMLLRHFVRRFNIELGRTVTEIAPEAMQRLCDYWWPGNIRELQSVVKQALLKTSGPTLLPAFLPELRRARTERLPMAPPSEREFDVKAFIMDRLRSGGGDLYEKTHRQVDRILLARVLEFTGGNHRQAAGILGIARQTMRGKLRGLGMHVARAVELDEDVNDESRDS